MAELFGIAASALQVAAFAGTIITGVGRFISELRSVPASIRELGDSIEDLRAALQAIQQTFAKRPKQLPFERDHHANIARILTSCHDTLQALKTELPQLNVETNAVRRVVLTLEKAIKEPRVQELLSRVASCTTILQLSLTTLSLAALWGTQRSQADIQAEIRKLSDSIRAAGLFSKHSHSDTNLKGMVSLRPYAPSRQQELEDDFVHVDETKSILDQEIQDWRKTADDVATAVLSEDLKYYDRFIAPQSSISVDRLPEYEPDNFDPEPDHIDVPSREILEFQLAANQEYVDMFRSCGLYVKASAFQRRGIEIQNQLEHTHSAPSSFDSLATMKEVLVDILLECETEEGKSEAKSILQALLQEEVDRPESERDLHRKFRLYHAMGKLYFGQNMTAKARVFLERAFEGRKKMDDCPPGLIMESADDLARLLHGMQEYDSAHGIREWVRCHLVVPSSPVPSSSSSPSEGRKPSLQPPPHLYALNWCRSRGMDVDSPKFGFDLPCHFGMTPVQIVIEAEDRHALRDMLEHVSNVDEQRDPETQSTPLHMAASKRNNHLVRALLERGASPGAYDRYGSLPLHRCQSDSGGVKVAELLIEYCPEAINTKESLGKTPLYMACELGNEKMVRFLLEKGAEPDIPGPSLCTPLITAIELASQGRPKMGIIATLIQYHADPSLRDNFGRNAFSVAANAGLASYEIKKLLGKATPELRPRAFSTATASTMMTVATVTSNSSASSKRTDTTGSSRHR